MKHPFSIVAVGEILWDVYPDGPRFGGAPANFACCASGLLAGCGHVSIVSAVGRDELGENALRELKSRMVDTDPVQRVDQVTGQVLVELDSEKKATYRFLDDTAWDSLLWNADLIDLAGRADAVCFGTLGQRNRISRTCIGEFLSAVSPDSLRLLDVNLRSPHWTEEIVANSFELANAVKLNDEELAVVARMWKLDGSVSDQLRALRERFALRFVALTMGAAGAMVAADEIVSSPGLSVAVADTVGAGDAFAAALVIGHLQGWDWARILGWANRVASYVATQPGATPALPKGLCFSQ
jgi:fructokinase